MLRAPSKLATPGRAAAWWIDFIAGFRFIPEKYIRKLYIADTSLISRIAVFGIRRNT
jgi:hypothetical protein